MTPLEFEHALDRWGADLDTWPAEQARPARELLARDVSARGQLDAARAARDGLLDLRQHRAPPPLAARIAARAAAGGAPDGLERLLNWLAERPWRAAMLALVLAVGGYLTGAAISDPVDPTLADDVMSLAFNDLYAELDDAQ